MRCFFYSLTRYVVFACVLASLVMARPASAAVALSPVEKAVTSFFCAISSLFGGECIREIAPSAAVADTNTIVEPIMLPTRESPLPTPFDNVVVVPATEPSSEAPDNVTVQNTYVTGISRTEFESRIAALRAELLVGNTPSDSEFLNAYVTREQMRKQIDRALDSASRDGGGSGGDADSAADADELDGIDSAQFLRSDSNDTFDGDTLTIDASSTLAVDGAIDIAGDSITDFTGTGLVVTGGVLTVSTSSLGISAGQWDDVAGGINYADGNVGIGTTTPQYELSVVGDISATGTLYLNSLPISSPFSNSLFVGTDAGVDTTGAQFATFIGYEAGSYLSTAVYSNMLGYQAGYASDNTSQANFFGYRAGYDAAGANDSNFLGAYAGQGAIGASYSNFFGYNSGRNAESAFESTFIGYEAGFGAANASNAIFIGSNAGYNDTVNNTLSASTSIAIGRYSGTGGFSDSIALGHGVENSAIKQLNIGNVLYATGIYASDTQSSSPTAGGKVGIGTSTPDARLSVTGVAGSNSFLIASSTQSPILIVDELGKTGIGVVNPDAWVDVGSPIGVAGTPFKVTAGLYSRTALSVHENGYVEFPNGLEMNGTNLQLYGSAGSYINSANLVFLNSQITDASGDIRIGNRTLSSEYMRITSDGDVGIGTTTPAYKLTVDGDAMVNVLRIGTSSPGSLINNGNGQLTLSAGGVNQALTLSAPGAQIIANSNFYLASGVGIMDTAFSVGSAGNVLTSTGSGVQWVATSSLGISGGTSLTGTTGQVAYFSGTDTAVGTSSLYISSAGYVGVGTATPSNIFTVVGNTDGSAIGPVVVKSSGGGNVGTALTLDATDNVGGHKYSFISTGANASASIGAGAWAIFDATAGTYRFTIDTSGNSHVNPMGVSNTSGLNPALTVYTSTTNKYGFDLGYLSSTSRYRNRVFAPSNGDISFGFHTAGVAPTAQSSFTESMVIRGDSGFVGIGTAAPNYMLEVNGTASTTALNIPTTASASVGTINMGGSRFIHGFGTANTFVGLNSGNFTLSGGTYNTALGSATLSALTSGHSNVALGASALTALNGGARNVAIGYASQDQTTSGSDNVGIGYVTMRAVSGAENVAIGGSAFSALTSGARNVGIGSAAGDNLTTGSDNIIIGDNIDAVAVGSNNTLNIGNLIFGTGLDGLGTTLATGSIGVGTTTPFAKLAVAGEVGASKFTAYSTTATSTFAGGLNVGNGALTHNFSTGLTSIGNLAIGATTFESDSGILSWIDMPVTSASVLGTVQSYSAQLDGNPIFTVYGESDGSGGTQNRRFGVGTTTPWKTFSVNGTVAFSGLSTDATVGLAGALCLDANNQLVKMSGSGTCVTSSIRYKTNDQDLTHGLDWVMALRPVTFDYIATGSSSLGFIAEEVDLVSSLLTVRNDAGELSTVRYELMPAVLTKAIQELKHAFDVVAAWFSDDGSFQVQGDICVDDVCISREKFKEMILENGGSAAEPESDPTPVDPDPTPVDPDPMPTDPDPDPVDPDPAPIDPAPTDPDPVDPAPSEPGAGDPAPADPQPADDAPSDDGGDAGDAPADGGGDSGGDTTGGDSGTEATS